MAIVLLSLTVLIGAAALTIDVGLMTLGAQQAQDVADAAALGAGWELPDHASARVVALSLVDANNESFAVSEATCSPDNGDVVFWGPNETIPDYGLLGGTAWGMQVTVNVPVDFVFAPVLGLTGTTVRRSCTVVRMPRGASIAPMWISYGTDFQYGQQQVLPMGGDTSAANVPGSFGWLEPASGQSTEWLELLRGYDLTREQMLANYVAVGDILTAYTGVSGGLWKRAIAEAADGLARLQRATWEPWAGDTFENFHSDNPRIIIVPMCEYLGDSGSGARFLIHNFGAFWIESVNAQDCTITGRFIQYQMPGWGGDVLSAGTGLWTVKMVG